MGLQVVKYGTNIKTVIGNIKAIITAICIRENEGVTYEISYFNNGLSTTCWIKRIEFEIDLVEKKKAGLVNYDNDNDNNDDVILLN
jgi:hypothetical protein